MSQDVSKWDKLQIRRGLIGDKVKEGWTANQIVKFFKGSELAMRRADMLKMVKEIREAGTQAATLRAVDPTTRIPASAVLPAPDWRGIPSQKYLADFSVLGRNAQTGRYEYRFYSYKFSRPMSVDALKSAMQGVLDSKAVDYGFAPVSANLTQVWLREGEDW